MKRKIGALLAAVSLLFTGCDWLDGSHFSVTPHQEQRQEVQTGIVSAANYWDLVTALEDMILSGSETGVLLVPDYPQDTLKNGMDVAVIHSMGTYPVGAYAVESIDYELGSNSGLPAVAVTITYRHSRTEIQMIREVSDMAGAEEEIARALESYASGVVLLIEDFFATDFTQLVRDYAEEHPQTVMEIPQVTAVIHGTGKTRVAELTFAYQTSLDALRQMQSQVKPVFEAASLYVTGDGADRQKYSQLFAFLMERFDYKLETSITPAYSLLCHGVGDSRAFATVYAAMCRGAGLECLVVTGTHGGEPWTWNIVLDDGHYYHVDLLRSSASGGYREYTDRQMTEYVWDYSAYPECPEIPLPTATVEEGQEAETVQEPEESLETSEPSEPEQPSETENEENLE